MCAYNEDVITDTVDTVFPQLVPAGIINLVFLADADTKQGRIVFEGGYYLACSHICVSFPHKNLSSIME